MPALYQEVKFYAAKKDKQYYILIFYRLMIAFVSTDHLQQDLFP
jgi:hypothetical protein